MNQSKYTNNNLDYQQLVVLISKKPLLLYDLQRFAAEDEGRTELPSERRKREERERGNVPRSQEIVSAAILLGSVLILSLSGVYMLTSTKQVFQNYLQMDFGNTEQVITLEAMRLFLFDLVWQIAKIVGPLLAVVTVMGIIGNISQFGFLFSFYPLTIRLEKIKPNFRRILPGKQTLFTLGRVMLQVLLLGSAAYVIIINDYVPMLKTANTDLDQAIALFAIVAFKLLVVASLVLALVSVPDFLYQRHEYLEKLKTTVAEAKRERKDIEGDPLIRYQQRERAQELRKQRNMLQDAATADVVVTNPTHFAVGLKYDPEINQAPTVIAKGMDHLAFIIRNIAREKNIPIEQNPPLARSLYNEVEIGQEIPETLYRVVSLIFSKLERFRREPVENRLSKQHKDISNARKYSQIRPKW